MDERILKSVTKDQIITYLDLKPQKEYKKKKAVVLRELLRDAIEKNDLARKKFYESFPMETGVSPYDLERILECKKSERLRWQKEGKLKIIGYVPFKYGKAPVFDRWQVESITQEMIENWRSEHKEKVAGNRKDVLDKAKITKNRNKMIEQNEIFSFENEVKLWYKKDMASAMIFELCYWTMWCSRWAKTYQKKVKSARKDNTRKIYEEKKKQFYQRKNRAIFLLTEISKNSAAVTIEFYRPENPDRKKIYLCEKHFEAFCEMRKLYDYGTFNTFDYLECNKEVRHCQNCDIEVTKDYYSLYHISVQSESIPELRFSFHLPYELGRTLMPDPETIPKVNQTEQVDGMFRFGRALNEEELIKYKENRVVQNFEEIYERVSQAIKREDEFRYINGMENSIEGI